MAPHSSTFAWKIPWMEDPGGLQSVGSLRVRHDWATSLSLFTFFFLKVYFIFKLYIIVLVFPNIKMNPPQVYMCSPSWTLLPPPSAYHPSGSSQCTSPKHPVSCIKPGLATRFIHDILHVSMPFSHALEKEMATHSSVLSWRISGMGKPGGLPSMGSHRVGHDWSDLVVVVVEISSGKLELPREHFMQKWAW